MPHDAVKGAALDEVHIENALIVKVANESGLDSLVEKLVSQFNIQVWSAGTTFQTLTGKNIKVASLSDYTATPAVLDGLVQTFHPKVHGGILGVRGNSTHEAEMKEHGIQKIDLVIVNLPTLNDQASNIDVQAYAVTRSAAKNHRAVAIITNPNQYSALLDELTAYKGSTRYAYRKGLAAAAFHSTATYESTVAKHFSQ